jgi:uncharacterized membrane protein HdeD (DUF308 family)
MRDSVSSSENLLSYVTRAWGWLLFGGILSVVLGIWAWQAPYGATEAIVSVLGAILLIGGIAGLIQAFRFRRFGGTGWRVFQSLISFAGGVIMLKEPTIGTLGVGITICLYLFMSATAQLVMAHDLRAIKGSGWLIVSSVLSYALGVLLIASMPISAFYMPGIFLAVDLVFGGFTAIGTSLRLRKLHKEAGEHPEEIGRAA